MILSERPAKVLIVKPSALGDIVHALPFLNALRSRYPHSEIHWVVASGLAGILENHPMIDKLWIMEKDRWRRLRCARNSATEMMEFARGLRNERFDLVVDLQGLLRSGIISALSGAPVRIGFRESREGSGLFYTHKVKGGEDVHAVDRYLKLAAFLGCSVDEVRFPLPPPSETLEIWKSPPGEYAVIAPSAGGVAKRWPAERFGELASRLPIPSVVVGANSDVSVAATVVGLSGGKAVSIAGRTGLRELIRVIGRARYLISPDTGPMHIAAALGIPVFAIFGPTNPRRTGPYGSIHTVIREDLPCSPCYKRKDCRDWRCMGNITVDRVLETIVERDPGV